MADERRAVRIYCGRCGSSQLVGVQRVENGEPVVCLTCGEGLDVGSVGKPPDPDSQD